MSMTAEEIEKEKKRIEEAMLQAISRFQCPIEADYPQFTDMCLVEIAQKESKENEESAELFFYAREGTSPPRTGLANWIKSRAVDPITRTGLDVSAIRPAKQLFALILASIEALGYLDMLKTDCFFETFVENADSGYEAALEQGRKILDALSNASGNTLKEKLVNLNLEEIKGTPGEIKFLTQNACFNDPELQRKIGLQATTADILRVNIPVCLPSLDVQDYWKNRVIAEVLAPGYVGLGYPIGRGIENRHEQRAMYYIQRIYDPKIVLELLRTVLSHATLQRNVSCITVELVSKIVNLQFEPNRDKTLIYDAIDYIKPIMRNIPLWSQTNENSLRPYVQSLEQLYACIREDQERLCQFFLELHQFKSEMLTIHGVGMSEKVKGFVDFCETMLNCIYEKNIRRLPTPQLMHIVQTLRDTTVPLDSVGNTRIAELSRVLTERVPTLPVSQVQGHSGTPPAPTLQFSQPVSQVTVEGAQISRVTEEERAQAQARARQRAVNLAKAAEYKKNRRP